MYEYMECTKVSIEKQIHHTSMKVSNVYTKICCHRDHKV